MALQIKLAGLARALFPAPFDTATCALQKKDLTTTGRIGAECTQVEEAAWPGTLSCILYF